MGKAVAGKADPNGEHRQEEEGHEATEAPLVSPFCVSVEPLTPSQHVWFLATRLPPIQDAEVVTCQKFPVKVRPAVYLDLPVGGTLTV